MIMSAALALDVVVDQSADLVDGHYVWKGSFDPESLQEQNSPVKNVCAVFEVASPPAISPVTCVWVEDPADADRLLYDCALSTLAFTSTTGWKVVATPSQSCTGIGAQETLDEGQIVPTAISLASFAVRGGGDGRIPALIALAVAALALGAILTAARRRMLA
jgi:hypothetical protein